MIALYRWAAGRGAARLPARPSGAGRRARPRADAGARELEGRILSHDEDLLADTGRAACCAGYRLGERLGTGATGRSSRPSCRASVASSRPDLRREMADARLRAGVRDGGAAGRGAAARGDRPDPRLLARARRGLRRDAAHGRRHAATTACRREHRSRHAEVAAVVRRVGGALAAAAEAGSSTAGRPGSVLFDERGDAWLGDFDSAVPGTGSPDRRRPCLRRAGRQACLPSAGERSPRPSRSGASPASRRRWRTS